MVRICRGLGWAVLGGALALGGCDDATGGGSPDACADLCSGGDADGSTEAGREKFGQWGCVGVEDSLLPDSSGKFSYEVRFENLLIEQGIGEAKAKACRDADLECQGPIAQGSFDDGLLRVPFTDIPPQGMSGFVRIDSDLMLPTYIHFFEPLVGPTRPTSTVYGVNEQIYAGLASAVGQNPDIGERSMVMFVVHDCQGQPASGVRITAPQSPNFNFAALADDGGILSPRLDASATVEGGRAALLNVEPSNQTFVLRVGEDEENLTEVGSTSFYAQKGTVHYMHWYPSHEAFLAGQEL